MSNVQLQPITRAVQAGDLAGIEAALAPDVVLVSPITSRFRFEGRQQVVELMAVVVETLRDFRVVDQYGSGDHLAIVWRARVGDQEIEGVDAMQCDLQGLVRQMTVLIRPLPGLATLTDDLATKLARKRSRASGFAASMLVSPLAFLTRAGEWTVARLARPVALTPR